MTDATISNALDTFNCNDQASITWVQRAIVCASFVESLSSEVNFPITLADIGCGDQKLRGVLAQTGLEFAYHGFDLIPQSNEVTLLDIACSDLPRQFDFGIMLGVTEYLRNLSGVFSRLAHSVHFLVVSHVIRQGATYGSEQLRELKWVNHQSDSELLLLLGDAGFEVISQQLTPDERSLVVLCKSNNYKVWGNI